MAKPHILFELIRSSWQSRRMHSFIGACVTNSMQLEDFRGQCRQILFTNLLHSPNMHVYLASMFVEFETLIEERVAQA